MDGMQIDSNGLRSAASAMRGSVTKMSATLDEATQNINSTAGSFESKAAENLRARYTSLQAKFSDFTDAINKYATFLDNTASSYEAADAKINQSAEDLLNADYNA